MRETTAQRAESQRLAGYHRKQATIASRLLELDPIEVLRLSLVVNGELEAAQVVTRGGR